MLWALLWAQGADPVASLPGWGAAGLFGSVLAWLLFVHLPAKDKQLKELLDTKDRQLKEQLDAKDAVIRTQAERNAESIKAVVEHCDRQARDEREATERRHRESLAILQKLYDSIREGVHATRNLAGRQRLAEAVQSANVPGWTKDLSGVLTSWNDACERLFGWRRSEVVGKSVYDVIIPEDRRAEEERVLEAVARGEFVPEYETERRARGGGLVRVVVMTSPIIDAGGKVVGASTFARRP